MNMQIAKPSWRGANALYIARKLGLSGGLQICLDAGDATSLPAGSDTWNDLSGNGHHFYRGSGAGADAADPSINGTAGQLAAGNYLGFDGGDYLTLNQANPAWVNALHQDNATFSILGWVYIGATGGQRLIGTGIGPGNTGFSLVSTSGSQLQLQVYNAGSVALSQASGSNGDIAASTWNFFGVSVNEGSGAGGGLLRIREKTTPINAAYSSPSAGAASQVLLIASSTGGASPLTNGSRIGLIIVCTGMAIRAGQIEAFYQATRSRFDV